MSDEPFLSRWSRRKRAEARGQTVAPGPSAPGAEPAAVKAPVEQGTAAQSLPTAAPSAPEPATLVPQDAVARATGAPPAGVAGTRATIADAPHADAPHADAPLPDPATLTPDADFTPFMRAGVDAGTRNAALRKLFADPHFNVMDGLDIYIDDYSKPDPVSPALLATMRHARTLGLFDAPDDDAATRQRPVVGETLEAASEASGPPALDARTQAAHGTADAAPPQAFPADAARDGSPPSEGA